MTELKIFKCWTCPNYDSETQNCSHWARLTVPIGFCHAHPDAEAVIQAIRLAAGVAELMMKEEMT